MTNHLTITWSRSERVKGLGIEPKSLFVIIENLKDQSMCNIANQSANVNIVTVDSCDILRGWIRGTVKCIFAKERSG